MTIYVGAFLNMETGAARTQYFYIEKPQDDTTARLTKTFRNTIRRNNLLNKGDEYLLKVKPATELPRNTDFDELYLVLEMAPTMVAR